MNEHLMASNNLIWVDLEMTGLEPDADEILEMAIIVTDNNLKILAESETWVLACDGEILENMDNWNKSMHAKSGLLDLVKQSNMDYVTAESQATAFLREWVPSGQSPMCGNSICQDRRFLARHMRRLHDYFHYRNFDVSSFKLAVGYWMRDMPAAPKKNTEHRAQADIRDSIEEMRRYHESLFKR